LSYSKIILQRGFVILDTPEERRLRTVRLNQAFFVPLPEEELAEFQRLRRKFAKPRSENKAFWDEIEGSDSE
jgi:hypothetical protein